MKKLWLGAVLSLAVAPGWGATLEDCFRETFATNLTWSHVWAHDAGQAVVGTDPVIRHQAADSLRIEHRGAHDWSLSPETRLPTQAGELLEATAWVRVQGQGNASVCFTLRDAKNSVLAWSAGEDSAGGDGAWHQLRGRVLVPEGITSYVPRLIGDGPATAWMEDYHVRRLQPRNAAAAQPPCVIRNDLVEASFDPAQGAFSVRDVRTGRTWRQQPLAGVRLPVLAASAKAGTIAADLFDAGTDLVLHMTAKLEPRAAE